MKYISVVIAFLLFAACAHVSTPLSENDIQKILGSWIGKLETPNGPLAAVFRFETNKEGELVGFADSPDQNAFNLPVTSIKVADGTLSLRVPRVQARYKGEIAGTEIVGKLRQGGMTFPLTLKKGGYNAPAYSLNLSKEAMAQLLGEWRGEIGPLTLVFRFEKDKKGDFKGYVDSPDQGAKGIPITEAALTDGRLELKIKAVAGEYTGQLSGSNLSGEWKQPGVRNTLTLTKK